MRYRSLYCVLLVGGLVSCGESTGPEPLTLEQRAELFADAQGTYMLAGVDGRALPATVPYGCGTLTYSGGRAELRADSVIFIAPISVLACENSQLDMSSRRGGTFSFDEYGVLRVEFTDAFNAGQSEIVMWTSAAFELEFTDHPELSARFLFER